MPYADPEKQREWRRSDAGRESQRRTNTKRREAKRQWEHDNRAPCPDCGELMTAGSRCPSGRPDRCQKCAAAEKRRARDDRRLVIDGLWREGKTLREIADALGSTPGSIGVEIDRMRKDGWNVLHRRPRKAAA